MLTLLDSYKLNPQIYVLLVYKFNPQLLYARRIWFTYFTKKTNLHKVELLSVAVAMSRTYVTVALFAGHVCLMQSIHGSLLILCCICILLGAIRDNNSL